MKIFVRKNNSTIGPLTKSEFLADWRKEKFGSSDLICMDGKNWVLIKDSQILPSGIQKKNIVQIGLFISCSSIFLALIFFFAVGAIGSPILSAKLVEIYGPNALFVFIGLAHVILVIVSIARMNVRPSAEIKTSYRYTPRTSFGIAKLIRRR